MKTPSSCVVAITGLRGHAYRPEAGIALFCLLANQTYVERTCSNKYFSSNKPVEL